jgi:hypothetical protein
MENLFESGTFICVMAIAFLCYLFPPFLNKAFFIYDKISVKHNID